MPIQKTPTIHKAPFIYNQGVSGGNINITSDQFTEFGIYRKTGTGTGIVVNNYLQDYYNTNSFVELEFVKDNNVFLAQGTNRCSLFNCGSEFGGSAPYPLNVFLSAYNKKPSDYASQYNYFRVLNSDSGYVDINYNMGDLLNANKIKIEIDSDQIKIFFDDILKNTSALPSFNAVNATAKEFACYGVKTNYSSTSTQVALVRAKITNKNTNKLQFDLISCRRELDQSLGIWDNVEAMFYKIANQANVDTINL